MPRHGLAGCQSEMDEPLHMRPAAPEAPVLVPCSNLLERAREAAVQRLAHGAPA